MSVDSPADNKERGLGVEEAACRRWPAERVDAEWHDIELLEPACGAEAGTPIEVKSCLAEQTDRGSTGRIWIPRATHETLREHDGDYVVAVLDHEDGEILRLGYARGSFVDAVIDGEWWNAGNGGRHHDQFRQIPWTVFYNSLEDPTGWSA